MLSIKKIDEIKVAFIISTIRTFEEMAFVEVIQEKCDINKEEMNTKISIEIVEPFTADVILELSDELKKNVVENVYSEDINSLKVNEINDCIEEILNILTGNFFEEYLGKSKKYKIELPQLIINEPDESSIEEKITINFNAENLCFRLLILFKK